MKLVSVTRKGQVTIPEDVRKRLGIREGSQLLVEQLGNKLVVMEKLDLLSSLEELQKYCRKLAKEKGLTPSIVEKDIQRIRAKIWKEKYAVVPATECHSSLP